MPQALIVDDNDTNLYLLRTLLEGHGYEVVQAGHGAEALALARRQPPRLIVSDLLMPVMDGYAFLRQCKTDPQLRDVPFVVYTATYTQPRDERLARALGADAFVIKPVEPEALISLIADLLARHGGRAPVRAADRPVEDLVLLQEYTEVLVRKLEDKAAQLEETNRELLSQMVERTQADIALRDSEERYRSLFDAIADPLFVYDRDTLAYLAVNDAAVRKYGYSRDEFLGMTIKDVRPVEDVSALLEMLASSGAGREERGIWRHQRRDGTVLMVEITALGLQYGGRPACIIQARDVTDRLRMEAETARSHALLRAVADGSPDAVFVKDRDGRYLLFNEAASRFLGRAADQVLGQDDTALFDRSSAERVMESDRLVMASNQYHRGEERLTGAGGTRIFEALKAPYRDVNGDVIGVIGVSRDITERKREEEARRQQQVLLRIAGKIARLGGWSLDLATGQVTWSDEVCTIHDELPGFRPSVDQALAYYAPHHRATVSSAVDACATAGTPFDLECELRTAKGHVIWVRSIGEAVRDPQGRIVSVQGAFQDISDRKQAEDEQRRLTERLTATLESITDGFFTVERDWRLTYVNAEAERMNGRGRAATLGATLWDVFPDLLGTSFEREYRRAMVEGRSVEFEDYFAPTARWHAVRAYPSRQGLTVSVRDATASRQAQHALRLSEERFRLLSKATTDVVWETDLVTGAHHWHEGLTQQFGYGPADLAPTFAAAKELVHPDDRADVTRVVRRALVAGDESWSVECRVRRLDGGYTPVLGSGYIIRSEDGRPRRILGGLKDLTERYRAQESLLLRDRAIQAVSQGIVVADAQQEIQFVSGGFERMTGYTADEVLGRNCRFLQGPESDADAVRLMRTAIAASRSCAVEILNYRKDGTAFWNEVSITPVFGQDGQVTHFVGVQTDITERRRLEEQYRQAQKMEAVGRLAGGIAHDFNNLLTVISGYSELLLARPAADASMREALGAIKEAGEHAAALTRQLLGFSRKTMLQPKVLDLNEVVSRTSTMLRRLIGEDILLTTVLDPDLGAVKIDPAQMDQVLMNLAVNARDAMPSGGRLTVETRNVVVGTTPGHTYQACKPGPHVLLAITDTGCGMPADVVTRIFEPFYTTKPVGKGTGLGLSMVCGIIEQSGGCIHVYSEVGRGTAFKIYLPIVGDVPIERETDAAVPARLAGTETILVVEDADGVRDLASVSLRMHGYRVLTAVDGDDALRVVSNHDGPVHLVITDVVMPRVSGPPLVERLRAETPGLAVLFMSGYTDDAVVRHGLIEAGMDFLQKPYTPLALAKKVRQVLDARALEVPDRPF